MKGTESTVVMFRKWPSREGGEVIALFPYIPADNYGLTCQSFARIGAARDKRPCRAGNRAQRPAHLRRHLNA